MEDILTSTAFQNTIGAAACLLIVLLFLSFVVVVNLFDKLKDVLRKIDYLERDIERVSKSVDEIRWKR